MLQEHNIMKVCLYADVSERSNKQPAKSGIHAVHSDECYLNHKFLERNTETSQLLFSEKLLISGIWL